MATKHPATLEPAEPAVPPVLRQRVREPVHSVQARVPVRLLVQVPVPERARVQFSQERPALPQESFLPMPAFSEFPQPPPAQALLPSNSGNPMRSLRPFRRTIRCSRVSPTCPNKTRPETTQG